MVAFDKMMAVLAIFAVTPAMPTYPTRTGNLKSFTVNQLPKPASNPKSVNLPAMYASALSKYGATVPQSILAALESGQAITTPYHHDRHYLTPVDVGGTTMDLDLDTGSADLWVFSSELPPTQQAGHAVYKPANASALPGYSWEIHYGDKSYASGTVFRDTVVLGGVEVTSEAVEAATQISERFAQDKDRDGLMGLAFSSINNVEPQKQPTFFDIVKSQLYQPLFAACLKHNQPGIYDFGFIDKSKYTGSLAYTGVDSSQGFWMFTADSYKIGGASGPAIQGIADTGTTLMLLPDNVVSAYYQQVSGATQNSQAGGYIFDCSAQLPDFTLMINGYNAVVPGSIINHAPVSPGSSSCFGGIQSNSDIGYSIFGDTFLKTQYVVFDSAGPRLGFAPQVSSSSATPSSRPSTSSSTPLARASDSVDQD